MDRVPVQEERGEREKGVQDIVAEAFTNHSVGDLMQASVKLSEAFHVEMETLCYERHKDLPLVATTEVMPDWMDGDDYITGRESGLFAVLNTRLELATKLIQLAPAHVPGYLQRASVLCVLNRWAEARETYIDGLRKCHETNQLREALFSLNDVQKAVIRAEGTARNELRGQRAKKSKSLPTSFASLPASLTAHRSSRLSSSSTDSPTSKQPLASLSEQSTAAKQLCR